ncbi:MAG: hypothetical protein ACLVKO_00830 [Dysgonomonas sp.]
MQIVVNPKYDFLRKFVEELPSKFDESGEQIFGGRNVIKIMDINGLCINVKSFKKTEYYQSFCLRKFQKIKSPAFI